jgi:RHS repeat-associated protein
MWEANGQGNFPRNSMLPSSNVYNGVGGGNHRSDVTYDHGNEISMPSVCDNCLAYDAENRLISYTPSNTAYSYDGNGQRVMKQSASDSTVYVYDAFRQLAAEYDTGGSPLSPCSTCYLFSDFLGSVRMITDQNGQVVSRHDYLPFGEELFGAALGRPNPWGPLADTVSQRFTGKERDSESGLDYFGARYCGSALGRFTSPDPKGIPDEFDNPQAWNEYAYAGNNPLRYTDPD